MGLKDRRFLSSVSRLVRIQKIVRKEVISKPIDSTTRSISLEIKERLDWQGC